MPNQLIDVMASLLNKEVNLKHRFNSLQNSYDFQLFLLRFLYK